MQSIQNFIAVVYSPGGAILSVNSVILNPKQPDIRLLMYFYFIAYRILVVKTVFQTVCCCNRWSSFAVLVPVPLQKARINS